MRAELVTLANAKSLYTQLSVEQKRRLLAVLSPAGFTLDGKGGVRTVTSDCLFNSLYEAATVLVLKWYARWQLL